LYSDIVSQDPKLVVPGIEVRPPSPRKIGVQMPRGRYIPPMVPLKDRLARPSHSISNSITFPPIIDLTEEEEPTKSEEPPLQLKFGGRITTGGSGESYKQPKLSDPTTSTARPKQKAPQTLHQSREERWSHMRFNPRDTVWLGRWPEKLPPGSVVPPPLVQVVILMNAAGQLVETMMGFVLWDACLVSDKGQILAESPTLDLDPEFSGEVAE
jgi:hypothetical protein